MKELKKEICVNIKNDVDDLCLHTTSFTLRCNTRDYMGVDIIRHQDVLVVEILK